MEVDGRPSVHCLLERLGVISADEGFDENLGAVESYEEVQPLPIKEVHIVPKHGKGTKLSKKGQQGFVPTMSATSSASTVPTTSTSWHDPGGKSPCTTHASEISSPSSHASQSLSPTFDATSCSTPSTGDPTSFVGGLFLSPTMPTATMCDGLSQDQGTAEPTAFANIGAGGHMMDPVPAAQVVPNPVFENGYETYGTDNFADAICGMTFYDRENMYVNGTGPLPTTLPQDYSQWIPGVLL
ncbi:hypothetical protein LTR10_024067 [Elasticomyces elasticus]|uniref:Uncharacterized protein n=1 Tax=Exophiala sideris TaxID=1016849 RepID=A0ABR0JMY6_9EURO|nr:hypothetical protein LTR10_024067 [Elasticomyces elasticus]KAK5036426.1 hypothetical protein LTS07_002153 [Exophiala sideris]KAK5066809.1 hypothetical protein LTR69_002157 [Exophiala sideris]KAK5184868.1 hypothetical protein LTR44_002714 [Eurotiomycetes sp. CCFEE 6388]